MNPLLGFMPDADPTTPGVITDCTDLIPYISGMEGAPAATTPGSTPALGTECLGAAVVTNLSGTRRIIAGTAAGLYELSSGAWVDRSSGIYNGAADTRWSIAQFGDATIAANRADGMQRSTGAAFSTIASAPKAEIVFSVGSFVMALNVNDGAEKVDGWHCCAAFDDTDWVTSSTTQSASGRLVAAAGAITAGARLGEYAVAYKAKSMFLGQYVGAPAVWDWIPVAGGETGCVGKDAVVDIGGTHFFVGADNFWLFDGTQPIPIGDNSVRQWFYDNSSPQYRYRTKCVFDRQNNRVWVFFPSVASESCDEALVYHVVAKKWGRATKSIEAALNYVSPGTTFDSLSGTYDTQTEVPYDSQFWYSGGQSLAVVNTSHQLQLLSGSSTSSSFTTGEAGDDDTTSLLKQVRLRFALGPTAATCQTYYKQTSGDSFTADSSGAMNDGKFDVLRSARWHKGSFSFTGPVRVTAIRIQAQPMGPR
jgi:hypothetical protein